MTANVIHMRQLEERFSRRLNSQTIQDILGPQGFLVLEGNGWEFITQQKSRKCLRTIVSYNYKGKCYAYGRRNLYGCHLGLSSSGTYQPLRRVEHHIGIVENGRSMFGNLHRAGVLVQALLRDPPEKGIHEYIGLITRECYLQLIYNTLTKI